MISILRKTLASYLYHSARSRALFSLYGVVIKEVRVSFRQFFTWDYPFTSLVRVITIILSTLNRLFLGRSLKYSFSFTGEDRILEGLLKPIITENGFYVDVGCNHPIFLSNSYGFYRKGWKGICVDANKELIKKYRYYRPKDIAVCALVSDQTQELTFHNSQNDVLSTVEMSNVELMRQEGLSYNLSRMIPQTLTAILQKCNAPPQFEFLSIDVEEHDLNVLMSLDLNKFKPNVIVVEDESFDPVDPKNNRIYNYLKQWNYEIEGFILKNLYFRRIVH